MALVLPPITPIRDVNKCIREFEQFYDLLTKNKPDGYTPWFFPCKKYGKDPSTSVILKIDKSNLGSWHHQSACLTKEQCIMYIYQGYNIGISARQGDPLIIIDIDNKDYLNQVPKNTLVVTSRKRCGLHAFCWDKDGSAKINLPTDYGEIRSDNQYVLACGSYVPFNISNEKDKIAYDNLPEGIKTDELLGYYTVKEKIVPRTIGFDELPEFFKQKQNENFEAEVEIKQNDEKKEYKKGKYSKLFNLKVSDIIGLLPKTRVGHPLHDSDTDANFSLKSDGTIGHCWRHMVSLNAVQYLCVEADYAKCEDAGTPHKGRGLSKIKGDKKAYEVAYDLAIKKGLIKLKEEKEEKDDSSILTSCFIDNNNHIIAEQIYDGKTTQFAIYTDYDKNIIYSDILTCQGTIYKPLFGEEILKGAVLLPSKVEEYGTDEQLDAEIMDFIKRWLDLPDDFRQFALWNIKRSWVYDRFHTINYLRAMGDFGQGKTRFLDTLGSLHYKPIMTSGATTSAPVFRVIDKWRGTMIFDEADFKKTDESEAIVKIINLGYEKGKFVMRCDQNDANIINFFDPFCPKVIATRKPFEDRAVESRCITANMSGTKRKDIPLNLNDEFKAQAMVLRNKLLMWRFRNYFVVDPNLKPNVDFSNLEPRVLQIVGSFLAMFNQNEAQLLAFKEFITKYQKDLIDERANSWAGQIVNAIHDLIEEGQTDISPTDIIAKANLTTDSGKLVHPRMLSGTLKELGFPPLKVTRVGNVTKRCIPIVTDQLKNIYERYGVTVVTIVTGTGKDSEKSKSDSQKKLTKTDENENIGASRNERNDRNIVTDVVSTFDNQDTPKLEENVCNNDDILETISRLDEGEGVDVMKIMRETKCDDQQIQELKKVGDIFEPRPGFVKVIK